MRKVFGEGLIAVLVATLASPTWAQGQSTRDFSPPPLVPATPPPMPAPEPGTPGPALPPLPPATSTAQPGTPPPPANAPPPTYVPGVQPSFMPSSQAGYSPYGNAQREKPGPEVGLMVTESLFGILTAASTIFLPFLLFGLLGGGGNGLSLVSDPTIGPIVLIGTIALAPLAVSQAMVGIANGSSYYQIDSWIPLLTGLLGSGLVVLTYFFINGSSLTPQDILNPVDPTTGVPASPGPTLYALIAASVAVPLLQMAAINLFKSPKFKPYAFNYHPGEGFTFGLPTPTPMVAQTTAGLSVGMGVSVLNLRF